MTDAGDSLAALPNPSSRDFEPEKFYWDGTNWLTSDGSAFGDRSRWLPWPPNTRLYGRPHELEDVLDAERVDAATAKNPTFIGQLEWRLVGCIVAPLVVFLFAGVLAALNSIGLDVFTSEDQFAVFAALLPVGIFAWPS